MSADGPNSTSDFELQPQLLSGAIGGGVNSSSLQSLLLLFSTPRAKMASFIICVAPLCGLSASSSFFSSCAIHFQLFHFAVTRWGGAALTAAGTVHLGGGASLMGLASFFFRTPT